MGRAIVAALLLFPAAASAESSPLCVKKVGGKLQEPPSLAALTQCHERAFASASESFESKTGSAPSDSLKERWHDEQRAEVQRYLARYPERASMDPSDSSNAPWDIEEKARGSDPGEAAEGRLPPRRHTGELGELERTLHEKADGGRKGITPDMAKDIVDFLSKKQGSVSPEMELLLDAVKKDGAKLTPGTINRLKSAAQKAKGAGLELGIDKNTESFLLDPTPEEEPAGPALN